MLLLRPFRARKPRAGSLGDEIGIQGALRGGGGAILVLLALVALRSPAVFAPVGTVGGSTAGRAG